jgi:hypothetical protein
MLDELNAIEKSVEEVLINSMDKKVMSTGIQDSSMRGVQASPSIARRSGPSQAAAKKITKHRDNLVNENLITSILPEYSPPLANVVSHDSVLREFDYTLVTAYLQKEIRAI